MLNAEWRLFKHLFAQQHPKRCLGWPIRSMAAGACQPRCADSVHSHHLEVRFCFQTSTAQGVREVGSWTTLPFPTSVIYRCMVPWEHDR